MNTTFDYYFQTISASYLAKNTLNPIYVISSIYGTSLLFKGRSYGPNTQFRKKCVVIRLGSSVILGSDFLPVREVLASA